MLPEWLLENTARLDSLVPDGVTHVGFICFQFGTHVCLRKPDPPVNGVTVTLPRVKRNGQEPASRALQRCIETQIGRGVVSVFPIPQVWVTENSATYYFAGLNLDGSTISAPQVAYGWHSTDEAYELLKASHNLSTRRRDLAVLAAASSLCVSPPRRILLMVRELHRMGFERLRIAPHMSQSGMHWRCQIWPVTCISPERGAEAHWETTQRFQELIHSDWEAVTYSSAYEQILFGWDDAIFDTPEQLARKFLERRREIAFAGFGSDPRYVEWYTAMLAQTAPIGAVFAFGDMYHPDDHVPTIASHNCPRVSLPPPGEAVASSMDARTA